MRSAEEMKKATEMAVRVWWNNKGVPTLHQGNGGTYTAALCKFTALALIMIDEWELPENTLTETLRSAIETLRLHKEILPQTYCGDEGGKALAIAELCHAMAPRG